MFRKLINTTGDPVITILRLVLGLLFFAHGAQKTLGWFGGYGFSGTMGFFTQGMNTPVPFPSTVLFPNSNRSRKPEFATRKRPASVAAAIPPVRAAGEFMRQKLFQSLAAIVLLLSAAGCHSNSPATAQESISPANVDASRLINADQQPGNWMSYGRTYSEQRFSPLKQISDQNVGQLALAWYVDLDTRRGQEATPIVVDGVMYFTTAWSKVFAVKAASGEKLWAYDPKVPPEWAVNSCCDVVNRGVAVWQRKVFVGTLDGRLVALDAVSGNPLWETLTIDPKYRYTITGAPRVVKGKVLIGNGGAEFGVRGYVSAYDTETGKMTWRFYTVPGDPAKIGRAHV